MARRFSWCTVAALLLVLFVAAEGLRGQIPQPDSHKSDSGLSRGESKFNPKTTGDTADISTSAPLRVKSNRERGFQLRKSPVSKQLNEPTTLRTFTDSSSTERSKPRLWRTTERSGVPPRITAYSKPESSNTQANNDSRGRISGRQSPTESKVESSINGRNDRRHSSEDDPKKSKNNEHEVHSGRKKDRQISRRISTNEEDEKLDTSGPSVFTSSPHNSGSRTGRKIQMSHNGRELKKQLPASRRYTDSADQIVGTTTVAGRKRGEGRSGGRKTEKNKPKSNRSRANVKEVDNALNRRGPDLLSESESVRVDIPLAVGSAENPITTTFPSLTTLPASANSVDRSAVHRDNSRAVNRRSDLKEVARTNVKDTRGNADRPKSRGRSGDSEFNSTSSRSSRRGSSRFHDYSTTETIEQIAHPRSRNEGRNVNVRDRSKNSETKGKNLGSEARPRSRGRSLETTPRDVAGGVQETRRRQSSDRSSGDKRLRGADAKLRTPDNRVPDQDSRFRMRSRSRVETTTIPSPGITTTTTTTTTVIPETTLAEALTVATTESDMMITTTRSAPTLTTIQPTLTTSTTTETSTRGRGRGRGNSQGRALPKEDFFNQGLGFRARKVKTESSSIINESRRINRNETHTRGNSGSTLRRRPGHSDRAKSENTSPTPVISSEQTNEVIPSNEQITSTEVITKIESSTTTVRRGQKKQKSSEENSTLVETTSKATRRGNKIFDKAAKLGAGKTTPETVESDNYPPEFKARLSQLKTTTAKPVFSKGTSRASPESDVRSGEITSTSTSGPMRADSQGGRGRVLVDRERDEATRTKEAGGQRSSVYIGQDKFVNYWTNGQPDTNPRVLSVKINSVAGAANEGPATSSPSVPSFPNLNSESGGQVTAPPGFPWRDPLDQILGITTNPPVITASVASNTLDDSSDSNVPISARPVSPFVEVFSPVSGTVPNSRIIQSVSTPSTNLVGNVQSTTMATTMPSAISSIGSSEPGAITTMGPPATSSSTPVVTANPVAADVSSQTTGTPTSTASFEASTIGGPAPASFDVANSLLMNMQKQNAFGSTFDDLAFLNSLLQVPNAGGSTPKTLTEVEQLLANKILSLALNNPGLNRPSKAIQFDGPLANSFGGPSSHKPSSSDPIIIDLLPSSTATSPTWKPPTVTQEPHQKLVESTLAPDRVTWKPVPSSTPAPKRDTDSSTPVSTTSKTSQATTRVPVVITSKPATTARPRTTTAAPFSFGAGLWQALFGGNLFASPTTPRPSRQNLKQTAINPKHVQITPKPISTSQSPTTQRSTTPSTTTTTQTAVVTSTTVPTTQTTLRTVDISKIQVVTPNSVLAPGKGLATASSSISTTVQPIPINSKLDLSTSTFSPEADAKFLATLLRALQTSDTKSTAKSAARLSEEDELFLRALLAGQTTTTTSTTPSPEASNAALLAALLKAQGIEPPIPGVNIREQLQLASRGQSVTSAPRGSASGSGSTSTTTTRPFPVTTKKSATPRPTSRPRPRTTTWSPSSTYPPPLFSSFANYGTRSQQSTAAGDSGSGIFGATRSFSQFLGAALSGAAQQLQSFVRNGTRIVTEVVG